LHRPLTNLDTLKKSQSIVVIHNPVAGWRQGSRLRRFVRSLRRRGVEVTVVETAGPGHATALARAERDETADVLVAAGGDGTINEVAAGIAGSNRKLGILPLGTANVLAWEIGLAPRYDLAADVVARGETRSVRLGKAGDRPFLIMASAGIDSRVVAAMSARLKRHLGKFAYVLIGVREAFRHSYPQLELKIDGQTERAFLMIAANASRYGGPFVVAPDADLGSSDLQVVLLRRGGPWNMLRYGLALLGNRLTDLPDADVRPARSIELCGPPGHPVQADGDLVATAPCRIDIGEQVVDLVVPELSRY